MGKRFKAQMAVGAAGVALGALVLAGCGVSTGAAAKTSATSSPASSSKASVQTVTLWESHAAGAPSGKTIATLIQQFNQSHPTIHVVLTVTKASHKALGALAAGDAPVTAWISHYDGNFLAAHALVSWNAYLDGANEMSKAEQASVYPVVWNNGNVNGQHYRIQANAKVSQLTYNKALFAKAGIKSPPTTWAQLATDVAILKQKLPGVIPLAWKDSSAHILPPFLSNGGQLFKPGSGQKQVDFLSPAAVQTFTYFRNLYQTKEMIMAHGSNIRADFGAGKLAIADGTSAGYAKILTAAHGQFPVGVFAYPKGSSGHSANMDQGLGFVLMTNHTKAQYRAAAAFLAWWFSPKQQAYWGTYSGFPPETTAGYAAISKSYIASHPGLSVANQILSSPNTISRPVPTAYKEVQSALDTAFFNAVTGRSTVQAALQKLQTQANAYMSGKSAL